jgi:U4/U6 small nuclear ribonucleoprotein PRP31
MHYIAPNVSAIIGASITAKLVAAAGGIEELSLIPACNIQVLGA